LGAKSDELHPEVDEDLVNELLYWVELRTSVKDSVHPSIVSKSGLATGIGL
jgi:hypothetical protein